jgi:hypothetical protein
VPGRENRAGFFIGLKEAVVFATSQAVPQSEPGWLAAIAAIIVFALYYQ